MTINPAALLARAPIETRQSLTRRDTILYALGVGADELRFVYEEDLAALPTMAVVMAYPGFIWRDPALGADWAKILHGETMVEVHAPLPVEGELVGYTRFDAVDDKGAEKGAVVLQSRRIVDAAGTHVATARNLSFLRGDGGCGSVGTPSAPLPKVPDDRAPDAVVTLRTADNQAMIYRLSGDLNPLHIDPAVAARAGFRRPILHGLCSFGLAGRAVLRALVDNDAGRIRKIGLRFSSPVFPGETIRTEIWHTGDGTAAFRAIVEERDLMVLNNGVVAYV